MVLQSQQKEDQMSNYDPNPGPGRSSYDPTHPSYRAPDNGRPGYILLAALAAVVLVGGFLYFGNPMNGTIGPEQAQAPAPIERTVTDTPAPAPMPAAPQE